MGGQERQLKKGQKQAIWWIHQFNCVFEVQRVRYRTRCMSVAVAGCYSFNVQLLHLLLYAGLSQRTGGHMF